ncbi:MAG: hypothetical protein Tsb0010_09960 [Parvularculaceae bacterium]
MTLNKFLMLAFAILLAAAFFGAIKFSSAAISDVPLLINYFSGHELLIAQSVTRALAGMAVFLALIAMAGAAGVSMFRVYLNFGAAPLRGWIAAAITAGIHIGVNVAFFLETPERLAELSIFNLYVSGVTALGGGLIEEIIFRGVILAGLLRAGYTKTSAIVISAALFAASHAGWLASAPADAVEFLRATSPIWGTFILALALGFTYTESRGNLAPVVAAHATINLVLEPWLLLSFAS